MTDQTGNRNANKSKPAAAPSKAAQEKAGTTVATTTNPAPAAPSNPNLTPTQPSSTTISRR